MRGYGTRKARYAYMKKEEVLYLRTGCKDQSSFNGIIPVQDGWYGIVIHLAHHTIKDVIFECVSLSIYMAVQIF